MPAPVSTRNSAKLQKSHAKRGRRRGDEIHAERHHEQLAAAEPVGQVAEQQRAGDRAGEIGARDQPDFGLGEAQHRALPQRADDRAGDRHFEPVEHPGDAKRDDDQRMKPGPRQPIEPGRDVGLDDRDIDVRARIGHNRRTPNRPSPQQAKPPNEPAFSVAGLCRAGPVRAQRSPAAQQNAARAEATSPGPTSPWDHPGRGAARAFGIAGPAAARPAGRDIADDRQGGRRGVRRCSARDRGEIRRTSLREIRGRKTGPGHAETGQSRGANHVPAVRMAAARRRGRGRLAAHRARSVSAAGVDRADGQRPVLPRPRARRRVAACPGARRCAAVGSLHVLRTAPARRAACGTRAGPGRSRGRGRRPVASPAPPAGRCRASRAGDRAGRDFLDCGDAACRARAGAADPDGDIDRDQRLCRDPGDACDRPHAAGAGDERFAAAAYR